MISKLEKLINYQDDNGNLIKVDNTSLSNKFLAEFHSKNASISIGGQCNLTGLTVKLNKNSELIIEDLSIVRGTINIGSFSKVIIGKSANVTSNLLIRCAEKTEVIIGNDCLFASDVKIRSCDGHPIFSTETKLRLNESQSIYIGNHVWLCDEVMILKGVTIGDGSIVGARGLVLSDIPKKSLAVGIPAKVVGQNVTWEQSLGLWTEDLYDKH